MPFGQQDNENPFTLVYKALWDSARNNEILSQWISSGNQIDYSEDLDPKSNISDADRPELALISDAFRANLQNTSSTTQVVKTYSWIVTTGDYRITEVFGPVMWELFRSMVEWDTILTSLRWKNDPFVKEVRSLSGTEGTSLVTENNLIRGWAAIWPIEVDMHFQTRNLRWVYTQENLG